MKYVGQLFYASTVLMAVAAGSVQAQQVTVDARSITSRIDQMERRVTAVENTRFSGGGVSGGSAVADLELRLQDLEQENAALNGAIERLSKVVVDLATKVDGYQKDIDLRLQDMENRPAGTPVAPHQTTGTPVAAHGAATSPTAAASPVDATDIPAGMGAQEMYSRAYGYLTAADYPQAEKWMAEFIKRYPSDKLSENGYYWLGEIRLVRNNPQGAALAFRDGLKAFPKGTKAAGSMLKLGVALNQLKKPDLAKGMWEKVVKDYPASTEAKKAQEFLAGLPKAG
jgi:tol-pal system protein YbgF